MEIVISDAEAKNNIAFHVNQILGKQRHSRYWLAQETGEYEGTIANICHGRVICRAGLLARIASVLGVPADDLLKPIPRKFQNFPKSA